VSFLKKRKTKNLYPIEILSASFSILVFYLRGAAGHLCLALSASYSFLDFREALEFHPFFTSYFVLHNSYIKILFIHKYKSSWKCSNTAAERSEIAR